MPVTWSKLQLLHMPKTAGTRLRFVLSKVLDEEFDPLEKKIHHPPSTWDRFTIMTMRNPLDMYVSEWGMGVTYKKGSQYSNLQALDLHDVYGDDVTDAGAFHEWLQYMFTYSPSLMTRRFFYTCPEENRVDAWVFYENLEEDLVKALSKAETRGIVLIDGWKSLVHELLKIRSLESKGRHDNFSVYYLNHPEDRKHVIKNESFLFTRFYPGWIR